jgi:hypothetical protein
MMMCMNFDTDRIDELHGVISTVAAGAAQGTDFNQISEYLELIYPPPEVLDPTAQNARGQPSFATINVSIVGGHHNQLVATAVKHSCITYC